MKAKKTLAAVLLLLVVPVFAALAADENQPQLGQMWVTWIGSVAALVFALFLALGVLKKDAGTDKMKEISKAVQVGALAYLKQQYKVVGIIFAGLFVLFVLLSFVLNLISRFVPFAFLTGGFFSGMAGFIGMSVATRANARTAWAARNSLNDGLRVAFSAGTVMGMVVVGLGLLDLSIWWLVLYLFRLPPGEIPPIMITFGMGASSMALFARVGGGIFTKAADVGADLVGKVESGIPEDDPRNPAVIADNVGDNVGDVAGMGADLYESYVGSIVATMALGAIASLGIPGLTALQAIQVPVTIATIGVISSILGTFLVRSKEQAAQSVLLAALRRGTYSSTILIAVLSFIYVFFAVGRGFLGVWGALIAGLIAGNLIGFFTEYYTSDSYKPTRGVADQTLTGPATLIIGGLSLGMLSTLIPVAVVVIATLAAFALSGGFAHAELGLYGIGLSAVGMLSTLGITLATDAYGPVADNAGGIAEMAKMEPHVRERTDALDSLGNTTAATGKGFAIASAALTALSLIAEYGNKVKEGVGQLFTTVAQSQVFERFYAGLITVTRDASQAVTNVQLRIDMLDPRILIGIFLGAVLPFVFCALAMRAVGKAAGRMVQEVRRQFKEKPGILQGTDNPDYATCVAISTQGAQKAMILPSLMAIIAPVGVGIVFGPFTVIAMLASSMATGFVLAVMMANSGGIWDNAKKFIERGAHGGKGSPAHKAAVVGDTVGDPFKDTAGPSLNILLKLMSMVSIVFVTVCLSLNNLLVRGLNL
jgi:K(+)-stimulated pyrophosphate-energized sodium pump